MASTSDSVTTAGRHIALLIDADNVSSAKLPQILAELAKYGTANIRRAYGDWTAPTLKGWTEQLHEYAIRPIQQFGYSKGKNATDMALVIDALELLYTQRLAGFCIASSDADFTPLVMHLRASGHDVYGFGERKTPKPFVNACTTFLYLEGLGEGEAQTSTTTIAKPAIKPGGSANRAAMAKQAARPLAQDAKLVTILRGALDATVRDDGWALVSAAGSAAKRLDPTTDPSNFGLKTFTKLFDATGLFEVVRREDGKCFVADKRNKDRAKQPGG